MKKLLLLFTLAVAVMMAGCKEGLVDYETTISWEIENLTASEVIFMAEAGATAIPYDAYEVVIPPQERKEVAHGHGSSADNANDLPDLYHPDEPMSDSRCTLKVGDQILPETVWIRRLWHYSAEPLRGTYKLIITKELIEMVGL